MKWAVLAVASLVCGAFAQWAHVPAAWLIAPLVVAIVAAVFGGYRLGLPRWSLAAPQGIIGMTIAQSFTLPILAEVAAQWIPIGAVVLSTVGAAGIAGWILARYTSLHPATAAWGSSPGAAVTMIALSGEFGADPRIVAFMQYLRVTLVVLTASAVSTFLVPPTVHAAHAAAGTAPFVALPFVLTLVVALGSAFAGRYSRVPGGQFIFPLLAGATVHVSGVFAIDIPWWLLDAAYITIGWTIGLQYTRATLNTVARILPTLLFSTGVLLALCALSGVLLIVLVHADPLSAYLATTPGGLDSVSIIALGSGSNVALVLAIQMLRLFAVVASGPPLAKLISRFA